MYDSVQLVQNSVALNGSQRVLLDNVITEEECLELRNLAHVRNLYNFNKIRTLNQQISHKQQKKDSLLKVFFGCVLGFQAVTLAGDGYRGKMSPHTPNEKFEGATVLKTLQVHKHKHITR